MFPWVDAVRANLGRKPREISADAGYCSEDNLLALATRKIHAYSLPGEPSIRLETTRKVGGERTQKMLAEAEARRLSAAGTDRESRIVEPVFGQIKQARGFRQFLLRGIEAVQAEWALICTTHNITKLAKAIWGRPSQILTPPRRYLDGLVVCTVRRDRDIRSSWIAHGGINDKTHSRDRRSRISGLAPLRTASE